MNQIMTSIHQEHTEKIFKGIKTIEWRKSPLPPGMHFIYEPKKKHGCGAVVGYMYISRNYKFNSVNEIPEWIIQKGCVSKEFLHKYSRNKTLYANVIFAPRRFDKPKPLSDFISLSKDVPCKYPPQSYYYVTERSTS